MNDEAKKNNGESQETGSVVLDAETYQAILTRLSELEDAAEEGGDGDGDDLSPVDRLALEAKPTETHAAAEEEIDLDKLSRKDLIQFIERGVLNNVAQPLLVKIFELGVKMDLQDIKGKIGEEDFNKYKGKMYKIARDNPNLSMDDVLKLAKGGKKEEVIKEGDDETKPKEGDKGKGKDLLRHLPKVPIIGEKPGASSTLIAEDHPKERKQAVSRAWDDLEKKGLIK